MCCHAAVETYMKPLTHRTFGAGAWKWRFSTDLVSRVTDAVQEDVSDWQNQPLKPMYAVVSFVCLKVFLKFH